MTLAPRFWSSVPPSPSYMYDPMKRHQIEVLRDAVFSLRQVARKAKVSLDMVQRILRDRTAANGPDPRPVGRPALATIFEPTVREILREQVDLPTVEILRQLRRLGYAGGKNPAYRLVRQVRQVTTPPMVRFEGLPGEFAQVDFGHVRVGYDDGTTEILHFFAARLKWSRWVHVELVENEQVESLVRDFLSAFDLFGNRPSSASAKRARSSPPESGWGRPLPPTHPSSSIGSAAPSRWGGRRPDGSSSTG